MNGHLVASKHTVRFLETIPEFISFWMSPYQSNLWKRTCFCNHGNKKTGIPLVMNQQEILCIASDLVYLVGLYGWSFGSDDKQSEILSMSP